MNHSISTTNYSLRLGTEKDFSSIIALQNQNLHERLSHQERQNGFLQVAFSTEHLTKLMAENGVVIMLKNDHLMGYALAGGWPVFKEETIFKEMIKVFDGERFATHRLNLDNTFQYGPICIESQFRGGPHRVLPSLFERVQHFFAKRYPVGLTFISSHNPRSLNAHKNKLGMTVIGEFTHQKTLYHILAFLTQPL